MFDLTNSAAAQIAPARDLIERHRRLSSEGLNSFAILRFRPRPGYETLRLMSADANLMSAVEARELAARAHGDQRDRDGTLHIDHVARVAQNVSTDDAHQRVAWLHDVIEDCGLTIVDLEPRLNEAERDALVLLTHDLALESYADYVQRIADATGEAGMLARTVKEADLLDNLRRCARDRDVAVAQYGKALAALWSSATYARE